MKALFPPEKGTPLPMIVKCVTCQRSFDSTKFSVDCPHDVELSADLQRSSQPRPPVSVPPYTPGVTRRVKYLSAPGGEGEPWVKKEDAASATEEMTALAGYPICGDVKVGPEDITDEMLAALRDFAKNKMCGGPPWSNYGEKKLMAAAINIYREHTAITFSADSLKAVTENVIHSINANLDR